MAKLWGREWTKDELLQRVGSLDQIADATLVEVGDGPGRGVRLLQIRNAGVLAFDVVLDRASDIGRVEALGRPVAFLSKVGLTPPWRWEHRGDDMDGFLRSFAGGLFVTCGLDHIGHPEQDPEPAPDGTTTGQHFPVHGRVTGLPATLRGSGVSWTGDECEIWAETEVRQAGMYGENLVLRRRISTPLGQASITVEDTVTNENFRPSPYMTMYHCNIGFPGLDPTARLAFEPDMSIISGPDVPVPVPEPAASWQTQLQQLAPSAAALQSRARMSSANGEWSLEWSSDTLPVLMLWQHFEAGSYVLGVQPSTNRADGRQSAREHSELRVLEPGETVAHRLQFSFK